MENGNHRRPKRRRKINRRRRQIQIAVRILAPCALLALVILAGRGLIQLFNKGNAAETTFGEEENSQSTQDVELIEVSKDQEEEHEFTICIDPGHGGKDIGANKGERLEKDDTLRLGLALQKYLEGQNVKVVMTREEDDFLKLSARCKIANKAKADYLVSLHRNTGKGNGAEAWVLSNADVLTKAYAQTILDNLEAVGVSRNRGLKQGTQESFDEDYAMNLNSKMPSCIIELGFLNSKEDNRLFDEHLEAYAAAIGDAIIATYHAHEEGAYTEEDVQTEDAGQKEDAGDATPEDGTSKEGSTGETPGETGISDEMPADAVGTDSTDADQTEEGLHEGRAITPEGSTDPEGNITSIKLVNDRLDESSADTTLLEWGQGRNFDELNRPGGCLMYQQKYGDMSAYFLGPWKEGDPKVIYLTFDIGYTNEYTVSILDTLKEKDVKAVFFATFPVVSRESNIVNRIIDEGHELGNHSVSHPSAGLPSQTVEEQRAEIMDVHNICLEKYGYEMHLFRFPAGKFSAQSLAIANNCNYRSVFWSWAHRDWNTEEQPDVASSLSEAVDRLHPGAIYLLHGISSTNAAMLGDLIDQARAQGYEFALLQ